MLNEKHGSDVPWVRSRLCDNMYNHRAYAKNVD